MTEASLVFLGCWDAVQPGFTPAEMMKPECIKMDIKARAYIFRHVRRQYLGDIRTLKTARECWKALDDIHGRSTSMDIVLCMRELGTMEKTPSMDVSEWKQIMDKSKNLLEYEREQIVRLRKQSETFTEMANIANRTVRRRLEDFNLRGRKPQKKPLLSSRNRKRRLTFATAHKHWTSDDWQKVLFSDESKFNPSDGIRYIRRRIDGNLKFGVLNTLKRGGGNVVVWACFSRGGPGPICRIDGIKTILYEENLNGQTVDIRWRYNMALSQNDTEYNHRKNIKKYCWIPEP
ncbi:uncharacterized protein LOC125386770 [Bombus terrestris]|uniref:Uncharacterized protein LOC125386770 n=1 Tax=Bombus terrestris TaxID=30195 RepID=A0A9C6SMW7_BOMTE|nr:uncharacterized protein LOC125386770 [Bombus terrestris]